VAGTSGKQAIPTAFAHDLPPPRLTPAAACWALGRRDASAAVQQPMPLLTCIPYECLRTATLRYRPTTTTPAPVPSCVQVNLHFFSFCMLTIFTQQYVHHIPTSPSADEP